MKKTFRILLGITAVAVVGVIIYRKRRRNTGYILSRIADEGYETAQDVLFPRKSKRGGRLHYGPILPS